MLLLFYLYSKKYKGWRVWHFGIINYHKNTYVECIRLYMIHNLEIIAHLYNHLVFF